MIQFEYRGKGYVARDNETLLECLLRHGVDVSHSCKHGVCNACMSKADGVAKDLYTGSLAEGLVSQGYFLPCRTQAHEGLSFGDPDTADITIEAELVEREEVAPGIFHITLNPYSTVDYQPGQFIYLYNSQGEGRPYSLASSPYETPYLELNVKHISGGQVSDWVVNDVAVGDTVRISSANGDCCLEDAMEDLVLVAFGVGMSSVYGILQEAVYRNNMGADRRVSVHHVVRDVGQNYQSDAIRALCKSDPRLHYHEHFYPGCADSLFGDIKADLADSSPDACHVFLCGSPESVERVAERLRSWKVPNGHIHRDEYISHSGAGATKLSEHNAADADIDWEKPELPYPEPCPDLWLALEEGLVLKKILNDFYDLVYEDPIMSPYFQHFTKQRSKEKVYSFYRQIFTGEKVFFGDRPKNAHSWMVINNDVYDYRLGLLTSCMRTHGLSDATIAKWLPYEEYYRKDIVKKRPQGRKVGTFTQPAGGFDREVLDSGTICDSCGSMLDQGTEVMYNLRTGQVYCPECHG